MAEKPLRVIVPRTKEDLEELRELDRQGTLVHGDSYPTLEQLKKADAVEKKK